MGPCAPARRYEKKRICRIAQIRFLRDACLMLLWCLPDDYFTEASAALSVALGRMTSLTFFGSAMK